MRQFIIKATVQTLIGARKLRWVQASFPHVWQRGLHLSKGGVDLSFATSGRIPMKNLTPAAFAVLSLSAAILPVANSRGFP
jgi:hypothetical protein